MIQFRVRRLKRLPPEQRERKTDSAPDLRNGRPPGMTAESRRTPASGRESDFYIDTKQATLSAEGHYLVGRLVLAEARALVPDLQGVGGLTMGADPIASAVSLTSFLAGQPVPAFYVRKEPKGHGTNQWVEGKKGLPASARVCVLEDVVTTGGSL